MSYFWGNEQGLYGKYTVMHRETGQPLDGPSFVLRPDRDPAARLALLCYAEATDNHHLAHDIKAWVAVLEETP